MARTVQRVGEYYPQSETLRLRTEYQQHLRSTPVHERDLREALKKPGIRRITY